MIEEQQEISWKITCAIVLTLRTHLRTKLHGPATIGHYLGMSRHWGTKYVEVLLDHTTSKGLDHTLPLNLSSPCTTLNLPRKWPTKKPTKGKTMSADLMTKAKNWDLDVFQRGGMKTPASKCALKLTKDLLSCPMLCAADSVIDAFQICFCDGIDNEIFIAYQFKSSIIDEPLSVEVITSGYAKIQPLLPDSALWYFVIITNRPLCKTIDWSNIPTNVCVVAADDLPRLFSLLSPFVTTQAVQNAIQIDNLPEREKKIFVAEEDRNNTTACFIGKQCSEPTCGAKYRCSVNWSRCSAEGCEKVYCTKHYDKSMKCCLPNEASKRRASL